MATMTCSICGKAHNECRCPECGAEWKYQLSDDQADDLDRSAVDYADDFEDSDDYVVDKLLG